MLLERLPLLLIFVSSVWTLELNVNDPQSIRNVSSTIAGNLLKFATDGYLLPRPYYWWQSGAMYGGLVDYSEYTGHDQYIDRIGKAILSQASPTNDFMMPERRKELGNDDQGFWALASMSAAEQSFPLPEGNPSEIWTTLSVNTFHTWISRWNTTTCGGGLKWQIYPENNGYYYKNSISNGIFFQLAARLARFTSNNDPLYTQWANKTYTWMEYIGFLNNVTGSIYDGAGDANTDECKIMDKTEWSYNAAVMIYGAAVMWDISPPSSPESDLWQARTKLLLTSALSRFFGPTANATDVMFEAACERTRSCNNDQLSFKAYLSRFLGKSRVLHPNDLGPLIDPVLTASAKAAANSCTDQACGSRWYTGGYDGVTGAGQHLSAMEVITSLLKAETTDPGTGTQASKVGDAHRGHVRRHIRGSYDL